MGEENKPQIHAPGDNNKADARRGGRNDRRNRQRWSQGNQPGGKFKGKTKEIEFDTFDNTGQHDAAQFNKSLKNIADYLQLIHGNDVSEAVQNLTQVIIDIPPLQFVRLIPRIPRGSFRLPKWPFTCGNENTPRLRTAKISMTRIWQRHTSSFIINVHQLSKMTSGLLIPSRPFAVRRMLLPYSS